MITKINRPAALIIIDQQLVLANDQVLDYDVVLAIINSYYVQIYHIFYFKIKNHYHKLYIVGDTKQCRHLTNFDLCS